MIDNRIYTFLQLCHLMNYRMTAEALNMTQPAVTQHIHYLEREYGCKLFTYENRILKKTRAGVMLEKHALSMLHNENAFLSALQAPAPLRLAVGATKTIGDYTLEPMVLELLGREDIELKLIIDNTENLLNKLNTLELDLLLIEGFMDKDSYHHVLIKQEELVGICAPEHPFAGQVVPLEELMKEHLILREEGSGTRAVFEQFLTNHNHTVGGFRKCSQISSFKLIEAAVACGRGVSFVYESIPKNNSRLSVFRVQGGPIFHEFNYVYLPDTHVEQYIQLLQPQNNRK